MNWYKIAQSNIKDNKPEYIIEKGLLYNEDGDEVFSIKELIKYNVPVFKTPQQANLFLISLEEKTKKPFGRVIEELDLSNLKYRDTAKDRANEAKKEADIDFQKRKKEMNPALQEYRPYGYGDYGKCPICGEEGVSRERRIDGNDTCKKGHTYPSKSARK